MDRVAKAIREGRGGRVGRRDGDRLTPPPKTVRAKGVQPPLLDGSGPLDRHTYLGGFSQAALERLTVMLVGVGALNARVAADLARKGVGRLHLLDPDRVDITGLNRTPYLARQIGLPKPYALAELILESAVAPTEVVAVPWSFQRFRRSAFDLRPDLVVCGVDDDAARVAVARWCWAERLPLIVQATTFNADFCYCLIQLPADGTAGCFGCLDPGAFAEARRPMPCVVGSAVDVVNVSAGVVLYAIDSLVMARPRNWTYMAVSLDGGRETRQYRLPRDPACPLCGTGTGPAEIG